MADLDLTALQEMKASPRGPKARPAWEPLDLASLHPGTYLAADQSISAFGLVLFEVTPDQQYAVHMAELFKTSETATGWEDLLERTREIEDQLGAWMAAWLDGHDWGHVRAVHEATPVGGGKLSRPEVSLLTSYAFRSVVRHRYPLLPTVRRQDHCKLICGDPNASKPVHHAALKEYFDAIRGADEMITNEGKRDALSVALAAAKRGCDG